MKQVLLIHPVLRPHGGGQTVAAWTLQALRESVELTLLTWEPVDFAAINRTFGTTLAPGDFRVVVQNRLYRHCLSLLPGRKDMFRTVGLLRESRRLDRIHHYDVIIGTHDEMDFGRRAIQYVHYPHAYAAPNAAERRGVQRMPLAVSLYRLVCSLIHPISLAGIRRNLTLANSTYVANAIHEIHGIQSKVVYPPVPGEFPDVPWELRNAGFVCLGRITPLKQMTDAIAIVEAVRARGYEVTLDLIGTPEDPVYERRLRALMAERTNWLRLHVDVSREEMTRLVSRNRFGLHAQRGEPFGIAVAEFIRAGCVTFVARPGGPEEIVGGIDDLIFDTNEAAVARILRVLGDEALCSDLRARLMSQRARFSAERFMEEMRRIVDAFV